MHDFESTRVAYDLLRDREVTERLGLDPARAAFLGLALVADADLAPRLASDLLDAHADDIWDLERAERNGTAEPGYDEDGTPVFFYNLTEGTRRCLNLVSALRNIAGGKERPFRAA